LFRGERFTRLSERQDFGDVGHVEPA
jgi:hypothetical protein